MGIVGLVDSGRFSLILAVDVDADFVSAVDFSVGGGTLPSFGFVGFVDSCRSVSISVDWIGWNIMGFCRINLNACSCLPMPFLFFRLKFFKCSLLGVSNSSWEICNFSCLLGC